MFLAQAPSSWWHIFFLRDLGFWFISVYKGVLVKE